MTPQEVVAMIEKTGIEIEDGEVYNIYDCGHVYNTKDDLSRTVYYPDLKMSNRSCPICNRSKLLSKYKRCGCGYEQMAGTTQPSQFCNKCPNSRRLELKNNSETINYKNGHLRDITRIHCINRYSCVIKYRKYETVPCLHCPDYELMHGEHDPLTTRNCDATIFL